jgi:GT2 family glycosyltransferase
VSTAAPVTAVVVAYNAARHLPHTLAALRAQRGVGELPVLVVDNASTDGSAELAERDFPLVRVLRLGANRGPAAARNAGLRAAESDLVFCLDADAVPEPDCLARLIEDLRGQGGVVACQPRALFDAEPHLIHYDGASFNWTGLLHLRNFRREDRRGESAEDVDCVISVAHLLDRRAVLDAGGFDEDFFIYFEDSDLSWRLRTRGWRLRIVPEARVRHRTGTEGVSFRPGGPVTPARAFYLSRNRWLFLWKCFSTRTFVVTLPGQLLYEAALFLFLTLRGRSGAWLRGKSDLLRLARPVIARRVAAQRDRRLRDRDLLGWRGSTFLPAVGGSAPLRAAGWVLDGLLGLWWRAVRWML